MGVWIGVFTLHQLVDHLRSVLEVFGGVQGVRLFLAQLGCLFSLLFLLLGFLFFPLLLFL